MPQVTWLTTVSSSPTPVSDNCVLPTLKHSLSVGCTAVLETGPLLPQDHKSGTVCRSISDYVDCHTASSGGYWRHFYLDSEAMAQSELFVTVLNRNILTYLLTYLSEVCHVLHNRLLSKVHCTPLVSLKFLWHLQINVLLVINLPLHTWWLNRFPSRDQWRQGTRQGLCWRRERSAAVYEPCPSPPPHDLDNPRENQQPKQ